MIGMLLALLNEGSLQKGMKLSTYTVQKQFFKLFQKSCIHWITVCWVPEAISLQSNLKSKQPSEYKQLSLITP